MLFRFKMAAKITDFYFCVISILAKFWKTTFPKEFFNEIWLKVFGSKYFEKLFHFKMVAKTIFWYCAIMPIYAN